MKKIIVDCGERLIRTALLEDGRLLEVIVDDVTSGSVVGNIYAGVVKNILPTEFAFVDIDKEKNAFLHLSDPRERRLFKDGKLRFKKGQAVCIQILKDPTGEKGAYATSNISLNGRLSVIYKGVGREISVSKKIGDEKERKRLKKITSAILDKQFSAILRTNAEGKTETELAAEFQLLTSQYAEIVKSWEYKRPPCLLYENGTLLQKSVRELYNEDVAEIIVNDKESVKSLKQYVFGFFPGAAERITFYDGGADIFEKYAIERQITQALERRADFGMGGFLIIEKTEACTVIDVNSGGISGRKNHEQSVLMVNEAAAVEIARQIRLRNISGIIIVDFVDMKLEENKNRLKSRFEEELKKDRISVTLSKDVVLGLFCLTRKKMREPLAAILTENCKECKGTGKKRKNL